MNMKKSNPDKSLTLKDFMPKSSHRQSPDDISPDDKVKQATAELANQHLDARTKAEHKADAAGAKMRAEMKEARLNNAQIKNPQDANMPNSPEINEPAQPDEYGGPKGLEPTRYGDWERAGRCFDF